MASSQVEDEEDQYFQTGRTERSPLNDARNPDMKYELRIIGLRLLGTVLGLVAGGLMIAIVMISFPAFLDMRNGRVIFAEVRGPLFLGVAAGIGIVAVMLALVWLKVVIQREREAAKWHVRRQVDAKTALPRPPTPLPAGDTLDFRSMRASAPPAYPSYWPELRQLVLDRDGYRCGNCGSMQDLHVHHIVPLSLGGSNEMGNLHTLCTPCHSRLHPGMRE